MTRRTRSLMWLTAAAALSGGCGDRDRADTREGFPNPREMALPEPSFEAPDPDAHRIQLNNGLTAYAVEDRTAPLVTVAAVIAAGHAHNVRAGAAEALAHALRTRGPATMTGGDFRATLVRMVAEFDVSQTPEETRVTLEVPESDWQEALVLLADLLRRPSLSAAEIAAWSGTVASASGNASGERSYEGSLPAAVSLFRDNVLRGHPFGDGPEPAEARALTTPAVRAFHRRYFSPANVTLALGGSLDHASASQAIESAFGDWVATGEDPARAVFPEVEPNPQRAVWTYPTDALQGWVVMGHELPVIPLEDQAALEVMNYILGGGHFDTRLFRETRDKRGLTNDDSGFLEPGVHGPGTYTFRTYGRPEVVRLLIDLTLTGIQDMQTEAPTEEELFVAKGALADGEFTLRYRTGARSALSLATEWSRYGDHQRSASYRERVRAVTAEDVLRVANTYLHPDRLETVILGPIDAIQAAPALEQEGALSRYGAVVEGR